MFVPRMLHLLAWHGGLRLCCEDVNHLFAAMHPRLLHAYCFQLHCAQVPRSASECVNACVRVRVCVCVCVCVSQSMQYHAQNLTDTGDHAKAIALFIQILQHHMRVYGDSHRNTATAALSLGHTYFELDRFKEGAAVFERVWPHARKSMRGDTDRHMVLFEHYMYCLIGARDLEGARKLRDEALARRLPAEEVRYVYDSLLTAPASEFE